MKLINLKKTLIQVVGVACVVIAVWWVFEFIQLLESGEVGAKKGYVTLQWLEYNHRNDLNIIPIFFKNVDGTGYNVIGLPTLPRSENPRVWILLNKTLEGKVMMVPDLSRDNSKIIKCSYTDVTKLASKAKIYPVVSEFLKQRCTK